MSTEEPAANSQWAAEWIDSVASGASTMSQRRLSSIQKHAGGLDTVREVAMERGVHLLLVEDEHGVPLMAASRTPFQVIC